MKTVFVRPVAAAILAIASIAGADAQNAASDWQAWAGEDLAGIHDALLANHAAVYVDKDSALFRDWLERGDRAALADLPKVADRKGYYYLLRGYAGGFRDSHIIAWMKPDSGIAASVAAWPGFSTAWRDGEYRVAYVETARAALLPPKGAALIGCDGRSAEEIARARLDRYEANLDLESGRYVSAPKLLWDMGNPFAGAPPSACTFRTAQGARTFKLAYAAPAAGDIATAMAAAAGAAKPALSVEKWGDRGWWIGLPSMLENQDWTGFFSDVERHRDEIRSAPLVVVDARGNHGGDSLYSERLADILWGEDMVRAYVPYGGDEVYRVSPLNRKFFADSLREFADKHEVNEYVPTFTQLLARMDAATADGEPLVVMHNPPPQRPAAPPANPMKGRIVLLTDYACNSACLDMMDMYRSLPNTVQAGVTTTADTIFMEVSNADLPSGKAGVSFGHKAWIQRPRGSNVAYKPLAQFTYHGDLGDDAAVRAWVARTFR